VEKIEKLKHKLLAFSASGGSSGLIRSEKHRRRTIFVFIVLSVLLLVATGLYLYSRTIAKMNYVISAGVEIADGALASVLARALPHLYGMIGAAVVLAVVSLSFQTITQSRVLTPSMIGFDSVFVGTQTMLVFFFGAHHILFASPFVNYFVTAGLMVVVSIVMFGAILRSQRNNIIFLLMFGLVLSSVLMNGARYLQLLMTEADFFQVAAATSVNVNNMNEGIIWIALPIMLAVVVISIVRHRRLNVMSLGPEQAKSLGIAYEKEMRINLILIAIGMSAATALIGSLTFLGLLAVNAAREVFKTYKHLPLFIGSALMAALVLVAGQGVMEMLLGAIPVTVIIDLVGCTYVFILILKENRL